MRRLFACALSALGLMAAGCQMPLFSGGLGAFPFRKDRTAQYAELNRDSDRRIDFRDDPRDDPRDDARPGNRRSDERQIASRDDREPGSRDPGSRDDDRSRID